MAPTLSRTAAAGRSSRLWPHRVLLNRPLLLLAVLCDHGDGGRARGWVHGRPGGTPAAATGAVAGKSLQDNIRSNHRREHCLKTRTTHRDRFADNLTKL